MRFWAIQSSKRWPQGQKKFGTYVTYIEMEEASIYQFGMVTTRNKEGRVKRYKEKRGSKKREKAGTGLKLRWYRKIESGGNKLTRNC